MCFILFIFYSFRFMKNSLLFRARHAPRISCLADVDSPQHQRHLLIPATPRMDRARVSRCNGNRMQKTPAPLRHQRLELPLGMDKRNWHRTLPLPSSSFLPAALRTRRDRERQDAALASRCTARQSRHKHNQRHIKSSSKHVIGSKEETDRICRIRRACPAYQANRSNYPSNPCRQATQLRPNHHRHTALRQRSSARSSPQT